MTVSIQAGLRVAPAPLADAAPAPRPAATEAVAFEATLEAAAGSSAASQSRGSRSGELAPLQRFESFVLRSFVETMLPKENTSFFGTGTAGEIWRSMLAERIGDEMAKGGGIGIADLLAEHGKGLGPAGNAEAGFTPFGDIAAGAAGGSFTGAGTLPSSGNQAGDHGRTEKE